MDVLIHVKLKMDMLVYRTQVNVNQFVETVLCLEEKCVMMEKSLFLKDVNLIVLGLFKISSVQKIKSQVSQSVLVRLTFSKICWEIAPFAIFLVKLVPAPQNLSAPLVKIKAF